MPFHRYVLTPAVLLLLFVAAPPSTIDVAGQSILTRITALKCDFPVNAVGTWQDGAARADVRTAALAVVFDSIDTQDGSAMAVSAFGRSDIVVRLSAGNLHFLQVNGSGLPLRHHSL